MKTFNPLVIFAGLLFISYPGYAQIGNLSNKVKNAVVNKVKSKSEKTETPSTKNTPTSNTADPIAPPHETSGSDNATGNTMPDGSNDAANNYYTYKELKLIPGAVFYFSDKPFGNNHDGAKTDLKSNGFVYGRLELNSQAIEDAFKLTPLGKNYYLLYNFSIVHNGEAKYAQGIYNSVMLTKDDIKKTSFNFDVLPDPSIASTVVGMNSDHGFDANTIIGGPMYRCLSQEYFPENGDYNILFQFCFSPVDGWGNKLTNSKDWPGANGSFKFTFNTSDVAAIKNNATQVYLNVRASTSTLHAMPNYWPKTSRNLPDASLSHAALESMIKGALSQEGSVLVKFAVANESPNGLWIIQKNDLGIPTYQSLAENIYTIYKKDGKCYLGDVFIAKGYLGGGKYGRPYVRSVNFNTSGYGTLIDCSAIK